jgi:metal-responsive CopG/Arc/MetJ family transcriptional regulator
VVSFASVEKKTIQLNLVISPSELAALDEWRARNKIFSRSEAIREAVRQMVTQTSGKA